MNRTFYVIGGASDGHIYRFPDEEFIFRPQIIPHPKKPPYAKAGEEKIPDEFEENSDTYQLMNLSGVYLLVEASMTMKDVVHTFLNCYLKNPRP